MGCSMRDLSLLLEGLLQTNKGAVLKDIMNKNGEYSFQSHDSMVLHIYGNGKKNFTRSENKENLTLTCQGIWCCYAVVVMQSSIQ